MTTPIRSIEQTVRGYQTSDGAGVKLTRVIDTRLAKLFDPFLMLDEFRSDEADDYIAGFPPHPHRGFETVTYMMAGRMKHGDNKGNVGDLAAGSVQWMTAARGIVHEERPQQEEGLMWGYQLWVNLPAKDKMGEPAYQDIAPELIPSVTLEGGGTVRVIAGEFQGARGPVRPRPSEPLYLDVDLPAYARFSVTPPDGHTVVVMGVAGKVKVGDKAERIAARELALLSREGSVTLETGAEPGRALVIAGKPFREPIAHYGPFVMNTEAELRQAVDDFRAGKF
jgi:redox-sensitive bicupin YhaK (pirin superfamily)